MGEFFKGWRRKAGLVTLAMAVLVTVAWMRSHLIRDEIVFQEHRSMISVRSFNGGIWWVRHTPTQFEIPTYEIMSNPIPVADRKFDPWSMYEMHWGWKWGGFNFGAGKGNSSLYGRETELWIIPYWSLVLPLTLLSAWLILATPRKAKAATGSTP